MIWGDKKNTAEKRHWIYLFYDSRNIDQKGKKNSSKSNELRKKAHSENAKLQMSWRKRIKRAEKYFKNEDKNFHLIKLSISSTLQNKTKIQEFFYQTEKW